jgi:hypothetical protein
VRGVIYGKGRNSSLIALDANTGKEIWIHEGSRGSDTPRHQLLGEQERQGPAADLQHRRLPAGTRRGHGPSIYAFGKDGVIDLREGSAAIRRRSRASSRTAGKIFENLIMLGSATGEGYVSPPGDLRAFDVVTGKLVWQFHTVPHPGEFGYETWPKDAWKYIGGTNTWGEITIDARRGIAYFPTARHVRFLRRGSARGELCSRIACSRSMRAPASGFGTSRRAPRSLGLRQHVGPAADHDSQRRQIDRRRAQWPARQGSCTSSIARPANRSGRSKTRACRRDGCAWRATLADAAASDGAAGIRAPVVYGRRSQSLSAARRGRQLPAAHRQCAQRRAVHANRIHRHDPHAGNNGGSNWGSTAAHPKDGTVYVENIDVPAIIRLLTAEERAARDNPPPPVEGAAVPGGSAPAASATGTGTGRAAAPPPTFPAGPIAGSGPAMARPPRAGGRGAPPTTISVGRGRSTAAMSRRMATVSIRTSSNHRSAHSPRTI